MTRIAYGQQLFRGGLCSDADLRHNARGLQQLHDLLGNPTPGDPGADGRDAEPPTAYVRFQLTAPFSSGVADAVVVDPAGVPYSPSQPIQVLDLFGHHPGAVGNEFGYAKIYQPESGDPIYEVWKMPAEVTVTGGADNFTVKIDSSEPGIGTFLDQKFENYPTVFDANVHAPVLFDRIGNKLRGFVADSDKLVATNAGDTPSYLADQFFDKEAYVAANHDLVRAQVVSDGTGGTALRLFIDKPPTSSTPVEQNAIVRIPIGQNLPKGGTSNFERFTMVSGSLQTTGTNILIKNLTQLDVHGPADLVVHAVGDNWVFGPWELTMLAGYQTSGRKHIAVCDTEPEWEEKAPVTDIRFNGDKFEQYVCGAWSPWSDSYVCGP